MSSDSEWYRPPMSSAEILHNELVMARDLKDLGFNRGCAASVIGWARALSGLNPAYVGTSYSTNEAFGLLSWDKSRTDFYGYVTALGYESTSGYGQLYAFDLYGPYMVNNHTSMDDEEFWTYFFKEHAGVGGPYYLWYYYLSVYLPEWVHDSLYSAAGEYIDQAYEDIMSVYAAPAWLLFAFKKKKRGGKLYL